MYHLGSYHFLPGGGGGSLFVGGQHFLWWFEGGQNFSNGAKRGGNFFFSKGGPIFCNPVGITDVLFLPISKHICLFSEQGLEYMLIFGYMLIFEPGLMYACFQYSIIISHKLSTKQIMNYHITH